jgi:hypothetical protein
MVIGYGLLVIEACWWLIVVGVVLSFVGINGRWFAGDFEVPLRRKRLAEWWWALLTANY